MTNTINISVTNSNMSPRFIEVGAEGQEGIIKLSLSFDDGWSGLAKSVVFYDKRRIKTVSYDFLGFDSCEVEIPSVILSEDGRHPFIVVGSEIVGDSVETAREIPRKITECAFVCVGDSIYPELNSTVIEALDTDAYSSFLEAYFGCLKTADELKAQYAGLSEAIATASGYATESKANADNAKGYSDIAVAEALKAEGYKIAAEAAKDTAVEKAGETATALSKMSSMYSQGQSDISAQREAAERAKVAAEKAKTDAEKAEKGASGYAATCGENASNSGLNANRAWASADKAQSYAVGHTGTRDNENTDNAKYYSEVAKNAAVDLETSVASAEAFKVAAQKSAEEANTAYESASKIIGAATEEVNTAKAKTFEARDNAFYAKDKAESARNEAVEVSEKLSGISDKISKLEAHTTDTNNPHNVTPEQIGAVDNSVIGFMFSTKEDKIGGTPTVGQVPVIKTVNSNGSYTAEWGDIASGGSYKKIGYTDDCDYKVSAPSGGKAAFDAAIAAASDGDTIIVMMGTYSYSGSNKDLSVNKNLNFVGIGTPTITFNVTTTLDDVVQGEYGQIESATTHSTSWDGFAFKGNFTVGCQDGADSSAQSTADAINCIFYGNTLGFSGAYTNCVISTSSSISSGCYYGNGSSFYDCDIVCSGMSGAGIDEFTNCNIRITKATYSGEYLHDGGAYCYGCNIYLIGTGNVSLGSMKTGFNMQNTTVYCNASLTFESNNYDKTNCTKVELTSF